jgi:hypothetical protein
LVGDEEEPVASPSDVAGDGAVVGDFDGGGFGVAIGGDVGNGHRMILGEGCGDNAGGGFDPVVAGFDAAEVGERFDYSYGAMEATVKIGDIVEENDTSDTGGVGGLAKKSAHHGIEATGFVDEGGPNPVGFGGKKVSRGGGSDGSGEAGDDGAGGFAAGVGVDDFHGSHVNQKLELAAPFSWVLRLRLKPKLRRLGLRFAFPVGPPTAEEGVLAVEELLLGRRKLVVGINLVLVGGVSFENHELFVVEDEVRAFVEGGEDGEGFGKFEGVTTVLSVPLCGGFTEFNESEDFLWKSIANTGDGSGCAAIHEAVVDLGVDTSHEDEGVVGAGDVFGGVAQRVCSTKFLKADERGKCFTKGEEEVGFCFEAVVGGVVDDGREVATGF